MARCIICRFEMELDDLAIGDVAGRWVCLRCYGRMTGTARPMPMDLQRAIIATLGAHGAA